jgi:hypothetical protein
MAKKKYINIGDTDENADWILSKKKREEELKIHDELAKKLKRKKENA